MLATRSSLCLAFALALPVGAWNATSDNVVLSEYIMKLTETSAILSSMAYDSPPVKTDAMETLQVFTDEPDQCLVVKQDGHCFLVFRGTTLTFDDWEQNIQLGDAQVCVDEEENDEGGPICCTTRSGFYDAFDTSFKDPSAKALRDCAKTCEDPVDCVILTGHSQGGALAAVAAVYFAPLNPLVITFGQPPTLMTPCEVINSERMFRFVNTRPNPDSLIAGITFDPVPFAPGFGADFFGRMIILSDDDSCVAYIGLDAQNTFGPIDTTAVAHSMVTGGPDDFTHVGYADHVKAILDHYESANSTGFPVPSTGFLDGSYCTADEQCQSSECGKETAVSLARCEGSQCEADGDCESGRCDAGLCFPKLGSCEVCDEDSDCESGACNEILSRCAATNDGLMDDFCRCLFNRDCVSGRCEGLDPVTCQPRLGLGSNCNEDSDCLTNYCTYFLKCGHPEDEKYSRSQIRVFLLGLVSLIAAVIILYNHGEEWIDALNEWWQSRRSEYEEIPSNPVADELKDAAEAEDDKKADDTEVADTGDEGAGEEVEE